MGFDAKMAARRSPMGRQQAAIRKGVATGIGSAVLWGAGALFLAGFALFCVRVWMM